MKNFAQDLYREVIDMYRESKFESKFAWSGMTFGDDPILDLIDLTRKRIEITRLWLIHFNGISTRLVLFYA